MSSDVLELFAISTIQERDDWQNIVDRSYCPFLEKKCIKTRKSSPEISIGTCSVRYGSKEPKDLIIFPHRFLERDQIFVDCLHLLSLHEPGNQIHKVSEVSVPGGEVDYFLVSARNGKVIDFVGIELQSLDTTGTVWPERQRFLSSVGFAIREKISDKPYGMNWKMTAKTSLVQMHHKVETFEHLSKHLVLIIQDHFLDYLVREFNFEQVQNAKLGNPMHIHSYKFRKSSEELHLQLDSRMSTDSAGIASCLGLQASPQVELQEIIESLEKRISEDTIFTV